MMMVLDDAAPVNLGSPPATNETRADNLRELALGIEDALKRGRPNVQMNRPLARIVTRALWDLADRVELD